jgi:hypothetical protein
MFANISTGTRNHHQLQYDDQDDFYSDESDEESLSSSQKFALENNGARQEKSFIRSMMKGFKSNMKQILMLEPKDPGKKKAKSVPPDFYTNPAYYPDASELMINYMNFACQMKKIADLNSFNNAVIITIIIAGINVGVQTYKNAPYFCQILDDFIVWPIFFAEVFIKFFAGGIRPFLYFYGPERYWNNFDFCIVVLSIPSWILPPFFAGSGSIALLRLVRLARLGKLIKKIPQLQMIMKGLLGGLSSIVYIILLLFLVFYLYAVIGFYMFKDNDPFHFGTLALALTTLFRVATLANWGDVMYLNMYGCNEYGVYDYYDPSEAEYNFTAANGYNTTILDLFEDEDLYASLSRNLTIDLTSLPINITKDQLPSIDDVDNWQLYNQPWFGRAMYMCDNSTRAEVLSPVFFISFVVISALVMLSLFIGAVTMSMTDSMDELKRNTEERKRLITFEKNRQKILSLVATDGDAAVAETDSQSELPDKDDEGNNVIKGTVQSIKKRRSSVQIAKRVIHKASFGSVFTDEFKAPVDQTKELANHKRRMKTCLQHALGEVAYEEIEQEREARRQAGVADEAWYWQYYSTFCDYMKSTADNESFVNFITIVIIIAGINVGASTDKRITDWKEFCMKDDDMLPE